MPAETEKAVCPVCHGQKSPQRAICAGCGVKSCPNGHLMSQDSNICRQCGWEQPPEKTAKRPPPAEESNDMHGWERKPEFECPRCHIKADSHDGRCPNCGYLGPL